MKTFLKYIFFVLLTGLLFLLSCKKEHSCENCGTNNPPIANAGPDQVITLPIDSVSLDGSASNDPDGKINSFLWTKISGPASFTILKPADSTTNAKTLVPGIYFFELKVTDNGGLSAKDTLQITVNDKSQPNRPPVANAGADQIITLPTNTLTVSGSSSTDPDNNITGYAWTKISGPLSITFANVNVMQTQVTNLVQGIYQFELKVTDARGLFSKDTLVVNVIAALPPTCNPGNRGFTNAQLVPFGTLSQTRSSLTIASAGNKILFAGGNYNIPGSTPASSRVDIYDRVSNTWSIAELSEARFGISSAVLGNKIFFAGGYKDANRTSSTIDIYDAVTNTWTVANLSVNRAEIAAGSAGNKVVFAGGVHAEDGHWSGGSVFSDQVDIYDVSANTWTVAVLSEKMRVGMAVTTVGNRIYFAGGTGNWNIFDYNPTSKIDIYDAGTNTWSTSALGRARGGLAGIAVNNKIYWAGGEVYENLPEKINQVEIKDMNTQASTLECLFQPNAFFSAVAKNNKIVFFTGWGVEQNKFDIYDITTNTWSIGVLAQSAGGAIISVNNTIYVAGGEVNGVLSNQVWKLEF